MCDRCEELEERVADLEAIVQHFDVRSENDDEPPELTDLYFGEQPIGVILENVVERSKANRDRLEADGSADDAVSSLDYFHPEPSSLSHQLIGATDLEIGLTLNSSDSATGEVWNPRSIARTTSGKPSLHSSSTEIRSEGACVQFQTTVEESGSVEILD